MLWKIFLKAYLYISETERYLVIEKLNKLRITNYIFILCKNYAKLLLFLLIYLLYSKSLFNLFYINYFILFEKILIRILFINI